MFRTYQQQADFSKDREIFLSLMVELSQQC